MTSAQCQMHKEDFFHFAYDKKLKQSRYT